MTEEQKIEPTKKGISRRQFIAGTVGGLVVGAVGGAAAGAFGFPTKVTQTETQTSTLQPWLPASWDYTADVVVVGFGGAGGAAAYEATAAGAKTIILERMKAGGGSTNISGGAVYMGGGTPMQIAAGFTNDTRDNMYNYVLAAGRLGADPDLVGVFADKSLDLYDWLTNTIGVKWGTDFQDLWPAPTVKSQGLNYSGAEPEAEFAAVATPVPRGHWTAVGSGSGVFQPLMTAVVNQGTQILYQALAKSLIQDGQTGRIIGVVASYNGSDINVKANKAVILTAGGFAFNKAMLAQYCPPFANVSPLGTAGDDGSGIKMGQAVGADVRNMQDAFSIAFTQYGDDAHFEGVIVDQNGNRFMAEDYGEGIWPGIVEVAMQPLIRTCYLIIDSAIYALITPAPAASGIVAQANTLSDLATALKTAPGVLENTISFYNTNAANHSDPVFNKLSKYVVPIASPPFYALSQPLADVFTMGGLRINTSAQVLDTTGTPIPGLYAAGRNSSSVLAQGYQGSGNSVGSALTFGRIAGQNAAAEAPST